MPKYVESKLRKDTRHHQKLSTLFDTHVRDVHGLGLIQIDPRDLFPHAEKADPSKATPDSIGSTQGFKTSYRGLLGRRGADPSHPDILYLKNPEFFIDDVRHRISNRTQTDFSRLMAVAKNGTQVLYRVAAGGIDKTHFKPRPNETQNQFLVVDPVARTMSYYSSVIPLPEMMKLFSNSIGDFHEAFWRKLNQGRKTPSENDAVSADYEPHTGRLIHVRSQTTERMNRRTYSGDFLVHKESAMPQSLARRETGAIRHLVTPLRKIPK